MVEGCKECEKSTQETTNEDDLVDVALKAFKLKDNKAHRAKALLSLQEGEDRDLATYASTNLGGFQAEEGREEAHPRNCQTVFVGTSESLKLANQGSTTYFFLASSLDYDLVP